MTINIELKVLDKRLIENHWLPQYAKGDDAGIDLRAMIRHTVLYLFPGQMRTVPTGLAMWAGDKAPPLCGITVPRSGLGSKGLVLGNLVGIIDKGYQGEILLPLWNRSNVMIKVNRGERVAQLILLPILKGLFYPVQDFSFTTHRGESGFGDSGVE